MALDGASKYHAHPKESRPECAYSLKIFKAFTTTKEKKRNNRRTFY